MEEELVARSRSHGRSSSSEHFRCKWITRTSFVFDFHLFTNLFLSHLQSVRQHSLSMLTDSFLDKRGGLIPVNHLCDALGKLCIPLAGRRIMEIRDGVVQFEDIDELMIELELCIGLIFKPLRHHLQNVVHEGGQVLQSLWSPVLGVLKDVLNAPKSDSSPSGDSGHANPDEVLKATNDLTIEHLRNVIMVLISFGVLTEESHSPGDITALTWEAVSKMDCCKDFLEEWKKAAGTQTPKSETLRVI